MTGFIHRHYIPPLHLGIGLILCFMVSCGPKLDPAEVDDEIVTIQDSLFYIGQRWGEEFQIGFATGDYSELIPIRVEMEMFLERSRWRMEQMEDRGGSQEYREQFMEFLVFESEVVSRAFRAFETLDGGESDSLAAQYYESLSWAMDQEQTHLLSLKILAEDYREKHGIRRSSDIPSQNIEGIPGG